MQVSCSSSIGEGGIMRMRRKKGETRNAKIIITVALNVSERIVALLKVCCFCRDYKHAV